MAAPRGKLVTPVGSNPSGLPRMLELDASDRLKVVLDALTAGLNLNMGYVNAAWQKNPILFGYSDIITGDYSNLSLAAGNPTLNSAAVPAGSIWVITNIYLMYVGTVPSSISAYLVNGAVSVRMFRQVSPASGAGYDRQGWWALKATNVIQALVIGATLNDDLYLSISGFVVNINL